MTEPVLLARDLRFAYGENQALRGVDLRLDAGRYYGVVGPNGCGKSTLLDILAGVAKPKAGALLLLGRPLDAYPRRELARRIAYVPQEHRVNFPFTVAEVALMGRHPYRGRFASPSAEDWRQVDEALLALELDALRDADVTAISGGEKQRAALARGLAQDTVALLLDEPTANLDIRHALDAQRLFRRRVREAERLVVAAMHDLNLAAAFCDELILMQAGRVYASGPVSEVLTTQRIEEVFGVRARVLREQGGLRIAYEGDEHETYD
jgi:iron complex transport system ATP-binding protein